MTIAEWELKKRITSEEEWPKTERSEKKMIEDDREKDMRKECGKYRNWPRTSAVVRN